ncbi:hypothetical protein RFI_01260 [Reticulomyxa filosa]|uniref:ATP-grasp domain-containing protein n=1 Tax=Reticulomyxa filosa TaxID=46433 RepID=X6PB70_RETFI|nr:hypothetical protein RFI_01260 [Reticulomyxa filosa]|eukprot:ETO35800.1 hypothetical protein RFI_01260 [Reticulomyxa filosa]
MFSIKHESKTNSEDAIDNSKQWDDNELTGKTTCQKTLRYAKHFELVDTCANESSFMEQMKLHGLSFPVVVKPPTSSGTEGVRLVYTYQGLRRVAEKHWNEQNCESNTNESLLVMEYLQGFEYVVNCVSVHGVHKCTDMWHAIKSIYADQTYINKSTASTLQDNDIKEDRQAIGSSSPLTLSSQPDMPYCFRYESQQLITAPNSPYNNYQCRRVIEYVFDVMTLFGVSHGCAHVEVMYLPCEDTICLIELNARMHGDLPRATDLIGYNQLSIFALSHMAPMKFFKDIPPIYRDVGDIKFNKRFIKSPFASHNAGNSSLAQNETNHSNDSSSYSAIQFLKQSLSFAKNHFKTRGTDEKQVEIDHNINTLDPIPFNPYSNESVRVIFLHANRDGYINFDVLVSISQLPTFKRFTRSLNNALEQYLQLDSLSEYVLKERQKTIALKKLNRIKSLEGDDEKNTHDTTDRNDDDESADDSNNSEHKQNNNEDNIFDAGMGEYYISLEKYLTFETVYRECLQELKQAHRVTKTMDLITSPGCVILQGNIDDMTQDTAVIRQFENANDRNGLYEHT